MTRARSDRAVAIVLAALGLAVIASAAIVSSSAEQIRYVLAAIGLALIVVGVAYQKRASDNEIAY